MAHRLAFRPTGGLFLNGTFALSGYRTFRAGVVRVELFNGSGQEVREQTVQRAGEEEALDWDISLQPQGLYLLRVSTDTVSKTLKVLH
ncbi:MAG: T9SS type A sorting domain-containing protein [Sphingobacteriaceae bacterium]|nr:T9SS type A sorting domain-containing protein [Cytophagaceae bacterium]